MARNRNTESALIDWRARALYAEARARELEFMLVRCQKLLSQKVIMVNPPSLQLTISKETFDNVLGKHDLLWQT